jgi:hypothetical protein
MSCKEVMVSVFINLRRLLWAGHVIRMNDERVPKKALQQTYGKRAVGSPGGDGKVRYVRTLLNYLKSKHGKQRPGVDSVRGNA